MKIHCIEMQKKGFDKLSLNEVKEMVGFIEYDTDDKTGKSYWNVTMSDGSEVVCDTQDTANLLSSIEEVKALLMRNK